MPDDDSLSTKARRTPWNKGKLIGAKPPLRPNQVWSIRTRLLIVRRTRDLALFNLAIDSKLRACDSRRLEGRRCRSEWLCGRSCDRPAEEDRKIGQVRVDGSNSASR